ncbi:CHAD domain-containing protein [bacterium]|nr:CHAD domain-containing protein [bacterium]
MKSILLPAYLLNRLQNAESLLPKIHCSSDPENLHHYRVSLRRARSLMKVYLKESRDFEEALKSLLKSTNELREMDVLVLGIDSVRYPLLLSDLAQYRNDLYQKQWNGEIVHSHQNTLHRLIAELDTLQYVLSDEALVEIGLNQYEKAIASKKELNRKSSAKKIHKVRIRCKLARYTLEFIDDSGLQEVGKQIKKCKKILNHFGKIQDTANQLALLKDFCKSHSSSECEALYKERKKAFKKLKESL